MKTLPVEEARARMLSGVAPTGAERLALVQAQGRVLAETVEAERDQPPFDASAMDGWAVRRADAEAGEASLKIVGESAAGHGFTGTLQPGEAVRIFTGAALPAGADMVVIQENAERIGQSVRLGPLADKPEHIRPRGGDFHHGDRLIEPGLRLDAWRLSLAAAAGRDALKVARRPRVAVLCTGEELVRAPAAPVRPSGPWRRADSPLGPCRHWRQRSA